MGVDITVWCGFLGFGFWVLLGGDDDVERSEVEYRARIFSRDGTENTTFSHSKHPVIGVFSRMLSAPKMKETVADSSLAPPGRY